MKRESLKEDKRARYRPLERRNYKATIKIESDKHPWPHPRGNGPSKNPIFFISPMLRNGN
jgi:hypothetical protein